MAIDLDVHGNTKPLEAAVQAAINRIRRQPIKITVDDKGATQPLGNMKRAADEFSKSMEAANARILAFGASMAIINGVADAFKGMVRNMVEVEKSMADINVVMGLSAQNLDKFGDGLFKVAKETGAAFRVAADAATEYARQGLSMEESLKRTRDALILTRLTGMDSAEAVKSLTAAMNTYGNQIKDTTQLVSKFAAVDVQFAVSAEDFAAAISRTGQAAKSAGVDIDELIGIVTSAQQQTARGGAVIGNALKTIFTKTGRTDTLNQLEDLGIAVRDLEGNTIGAKRILSDLANTFDTLSEAQKAQITQTMGGLFHINILKAVLSDAAKQNGILARATEISSSATDEAVQKNQQLRETMSAMATETGLAIKQVSTQIGELMLAPGMEKILNTVKSLAEGASEILGNGESAGNKFATGFLKGIGNIITGPGLVVLTTVFVKLFMTAAKFTKESLSSLIGVTSEAQKQKAIQTSLVALIGQNAALGKEMLRTDISRTEKEKILLGLLRMQTAEAENLNRISKQLASTLYTKGYGPGLTQGKRRAYGHIPNFADPERAQAAKGGYAAGSIRTMNMPGEGSVIYNSAETVKNFAGFKQPAIMPPQSSKAGKNYQQAFGSIHGFDPYAATGYIPNYAIASSYQRKAILADTLRIWGKGNARFTDRSIQDNLISAGYSTYGTWPQKPKVSKSDPSLTSDLHKFFGVKSYDDFIALKESKKKQAQLNKASKLSPAAMLVPPEGYGGPTSRYDPRGKASKIWPVYALKMKPGDKRPDQNLEKNIETSLNKVGTSYANSIGKVLGDKNGISSAQFVQRLDKGSEGAYGAAVGAVFEGAVNAALKYSAEKSDETQGDFDVRGGAKIAKVRKLFDGFPAAMNLADYKNNSTSTGNRKSFYKKLVKEQGAAYGHIPNFADPLSDAIGREKAAGVPVSQIRVGSHSALMSKGNPLGLGVTNTHDEPNGLRDVFGANGFVPNYAFNPLSLLTAPMGNKDKIKKLNEKISKQEKAIEEHTRALQQNTNNAKKQERAQKLLTQTTNQLQKSRAKLSSMSLAGRTMGGIKNMGQGMGGMGLMMGLPMLAGFIPGADRPGSVGGIASGMMTGAATGASLGMMFPGWGTAIGAAVGALGGLVTSLDSAKDAIKEEASARGKFLATSFGGAAQKIFSEGSVEEIKRKKNIFATFGNVPQEIDLDFWDILAEGFSFSGTSKFKSSRQVSEVREDMMKRMGPIIREEFLQSIESFGDEEMSLPRIVFDQEKNRKTISKTQTEVQKASEFKKFLESSGDLRDIDTLSTLARSLLQQYKVEEVNTKKTNEAIILRLNKEKTLLSAQDKFNKHMNQSAELQAQLNNEYNFNMRTRGHLMTESEKAEETYNQSVINAAAKYRDSVLKSESDAGLNIIKTLQGTDYESKFKDYLAKEGIDSGEFAKKSLEEQREVLKLVGEESNKKKETVDFLENQKQEMAGIEEKAKSILSIEEQRARTEKEITNELIRQKTGPGAMGRGMDKAFFDMREQVKTMDYELGQKIPYAFADGLANAMSEGLSGAKSIGDALRDSAISFLQMIQQAMLQKAAYGIVGAMGFSGGGNVRNYSRGGGVPAMVSNGEYVMGRDAVAKYGGSFMHGLNAGGKIPGYSNGGKLADQLVNVRREKVHVPGGAQPGSALASGFGGGRGHASGRAYQSRAMSGFFYSQSGNVGLGEDASTMMGILQEEERQRQEAEARRQAKKAKRRQLIGSLVGIAAGAMISKGASFLSEKGFFGQAAQSNALLAKAGVPSSSASWLTKNAGISGQDASQLLINAKNGMPSAVSRLNSLTGARDVSLGLIGTPNKVVPGGWMGAANPAPLSSTYSSPTRPNSLGEYFKTPPPGSLRSTFGGTYLDGYRTGYASGGHVSGKSGIDQIPAMLSEGEYVIRASSARQLGKPMLDRINAGKFNEGGAVSELMGSSETASSGGNTNNINISINMERGSGSKKENQSQDNSGQNPADRSSDEQNSAALADRIKQQVVAVIVEEQRPGGLLSE